MNAYRVRNWTFALMTALGIGSTASAQENNGDHLPDYAKMIMEGKQPAVEGQVPTSESPTPMITGGAGCSVGNCPPGCPTGHCVPGRKCPTRYGRGGCSSCGTLAPVDFSTGCDEECGKFDRFCSNLFTCFCCPDPCYEPQWLPVANSGMFIDHARPQSHMRIRYDAGVNMLFPDRNEFFWAKIGSKGPRNREQSLNYHDTSFYIETGSGAFSATIEGPFYRVLDTDANGYNAGWGDMIVGTKTMFVDCELLQLTFAFKTYIPIGSSTNGFGTGHVSLEPSLLGALKITPRNYLEFQISEWIPIAGDNDFAGDLLHYHLSWNHLWCKKKAWQITTSWEYFAYVFQDGAYTNPANFGDPATGRSSREAFHYMGPGIRLTICDNFDLGFGTAVSLQSDHFAEQIYRFEGRLRY